jgi:hypothetical protein
MEGDDPFPDDETGVLESLRRLDNWAEEISNQQADMLRLIQQQTEASNAVAQALVDEDFDPGPEPSTYLFNMSALVPSETPQNDPVTVTREIDFDGTVRELRVVSTGAAQQSVGAQFTYASGTRVMPRDDPGDARYVPLGDEPITNTPNTKITSGDEVVYSFANGDPSNAHFVTALVQIEEVTA